MPKKAELKDTQSTQPEQVQQVNVLRGALMDAILAENASREAKNNEGRTEP